MKQYEIVFRVNGIRTVEQITACDLASAKKILEAKYPGVRITYVTTREVR